MTSLFEYSDYRKALTELIKLSPKKGRGLQSRLSEHIGCQSAYLSRVLAGHAELNQEQALLVTTFFQLDPLESDYFMNLLNLNRAGHPALEKYYRAKLNAVVQKKMTITSRIRTENKMRFEEQSHYYSDWIYCAIHMLVATDRFRTAAVIAQHLEISEARVKEVLIFLESCHLIERKSGLYRIKAGSLHLTSDSHLTKTHHTNWRVRAIDSLSQHNPHNMNYSSVITCSREDSVRIRELMIKSIGKIREIVGPSPSQAAYCYNLDFFEI